MISFDYTFLVASIAITVVSAGYHVSPPPPPPPPSPTPVSTDCFTLSAHYANGTRAGFLYLFDDAGFVDGALTDSEAAAAKLALDTSSQRLIDYGSVPGHNGLIAATYQNPGFYSAVFFKTYEELQGITDYIALQCELSSSGVLSCNHPLNSTNFFQSKSLYFEVSNVTLHANIGFSFMLGGGMFLLVAPECGSIERSPPLSKGRSNTFRFGSLL